MIEVLSSVKLSFSNVRVTPHVKTDKDLWRKVWKEMDRLFKDAFSCETKLNGPFTF